MGARRADPLGFPPPPAPIPARAARRPGLCLPHLPRTRDATLIGGLSISNVRRGVAQAASIGYWIGAPHVGRGYMTDAVRAMLPFAFVTLGLHRLEAACLPQNLPPRACCEKAGFQREGTARRYLKINGVWQDHDLFALLQDDARRVRTARA